MDNEEVSLDANSIRDLIETKSQELAIRRDELRIEAKNLELEHKRTTELDTREYQYAMASLDADALAMESELNHQRKTKRDRYWMILAISVLVISGLGLSLYLGNVAFAETMADRLMYVTVSLFGGYYFGRHQGRTEVQLQSSA